LKKQWAERWARSPRHARTVVYEPRFPFTKFQKETKGLKRNQNNVLVQLRTRHIATRRYLHRIGKVENDTCSSCRVHGRIAPETVHHFLFDCPSYNAQRFELRRTLGRDARDQQVLYGTKKGIIALLRYVAATRRFQRVFGDVAQFRPAYLEQ
ncbi:hypothetical protein HDZ31DRAFT_51437, partial [Schizophyllum fasciatum]